MEQTVVQRPDIDIAEDIQKFIRGYDPLKQARGHFEFTVQDGQVTVKGHVRSVQAHRVMVDNVPDFEGVTAVDTSEFYDDETIRLHLGKAIPDGVLVRVNYGSVVVTFRKAYDNEDEIMEQVKGVSGVRADHVISEYL